VKLKGRAALRRSTVGFAVGSPPPCASAAVAQHGP
jgi:hypothetical protein